MKLYNRSLIIYNFIKKKIPHSVHQFKRLINGKTKRLIDKMGKIHVMIQIATYIIFFVQNIPHLKTKYKNNQFSNLQSRVGYISITIATRSGVAKTIYSYSGLPVAGTSGMKIAEQFSPSFSQPNSAQCIPFMPKLCLFLLSCPYCALSCALSRVPEMPSTEFKFFFCFFLQIDVIAI